MKTKWYLSLIISPNIDFSETPNWSNYVGMNINTKIIPFKSVFCGWRQDAIIVFLLDFIPKPRAECEEGASCCGAVHVH